MKVVAVVQARMGSSRFPGKVLQPIEGTSVIGLLLARLSTAKCVSEVVVATTVEKIDDELAIYVGELGYRVVRGSEDDVLARFIVAVDQTDAEVVVRITGDCPLVMPELIDAALEKFFEERVDYLSNINPPTYPDGLDIEVFSTAALRIANLESADQFEREHVTPFIRRDERFRMSNFKSSQDNSHIRLTLDEEIDLDVIREVVKRNSPNLMFGLQDLLHLIIEQENIFVLNSHINRNEGSSMGTGQKLWKKAKRLIPGGNMLLSKRSEMFLPDQWPSYFERTAGCSVWDLDGNEFLDMGIMGVGTNTLGYSHPEVDDAVHSVVTKGNLSSLNCAEEVWLAERLIEINPWADMVRLARAGGEANAIAIRIARSASGRDNVAVCGYHGWHDWYLSANLGDNNKLAGHLLPGLNPEGVPESLKNSTFPFLYNDIEALENLVETKNIGVIKMEVYRNVEPKDDFLRKVRQLASANGIVLVFDECTSGFRETFGGLHQKYEVEPDIAVYGKTIANGYALTAIVGSRAVMEAAQSTFISSTFWTERIGPTAALKTLEVMEREQSWSAITETGKTYRRKLLKLADLYQLDLELTGLPSLTTYSIRGSNSVAYKTLITQELLKSGILAATGIYTCLSHTTEKLDHFFDVLDPIFKTISRCENEEMNVLDLLHGPVCHTSFARLN